MNRIVKAFLVVPLVPSVLFAAAASILGLVSGGFSLLPAVAYSFPIWLMFALPVAYGASVIFGIPSFLIFRRLGWLSRSGLLVGASGIGFLMGCVIAYVFAAGEPLGFVLTALTFTVFGAVSGYVFWWFVSHAPNPPLNPDAPTSGAPVS
ncbi:MAG: hypothetical protein AB1766_06485 [Pseudomonadota bacterium]